MTLATKMASLSKNYEFPIQLVENILSSMTDLINVETQVNINSIKILSRKKES
jgi:hypothetical protein